MINKKSLSALLIIVIVISKLPGISYSAQEVYSDNKTPGFSDMPDDWSKAALLNAVDNGLLSGYDGNIMPEDNLTRAQMAANINRTFGTKEKASLDSCTDVNEATWYCFDMAKAVQMKTFIGSNNKLSPESFITREEAYTVIARAFKLSGAAESVLDCMGGNSYYKSIGGYEHEV